MDMGYQKNSISKPHLPESGGKVNITLVPSTDDKASGCRRNHKSYAHECKHV